MGSSACTYSTVHAFTITRMGYTTRTLSNTAIAGTLSVSPSHALPFPQLRLTAAGCNGAAQVHSSSRNRNPRALAPFLVVHFDFHNLDSSKLYASGISTWAKSFKLSQPFSDVNDTEKSAFAKGTSSSQPGFIGTITTGLVDTSKNAIKAVQVNKARHAVSFVVVFRKEGYLANECVLNLNQCYRNQMEEVIDFLETRHKSKFKETHCAISSFFNSEMLMNQLAINTVINYSFVVMLQVIMLKTWWPVSHFDDHNCPPIHLITSFCQSAYSWLKEDIENVVAVHCKAGMARTGLMICSLFLYLKFFPTAEEYMDFYNQKRCVDGNGLVLPSQIRKLPSPGFMVEVVLADTNPTTPSSETASKTFVETPAS
ncbi:hypothetical protein F2Q68_00003177 [Brassica cretica]|uniref:Tyrosine specific protein phosphatases domain-containing protein n=1 Tax=Brassica cretica TaxID=69181 RepID=A0A8S9JII1_BRACR|nr:hypothetical protein F2Q68_00003177 [Brassica cretica]